MAHSTAPNMAQTIQNKTSGKTRSGESHAKASDASQSVDGSLARGVALELENSRSEQAVSPSAVMELTTRDVLDATLEQAVDRAFLSPRVVDQATFDWLAGSLRKLTTEAASQHRSLSATTAQATTVQTQLQEQLRSLVKDLQGRVDAALKAIPALEARAGRAQALMDRVTSETALSKAREVRDAVIAEVVKQRDAIVTEAVQQALGGAIESARAKFEKDCAEMVRNALEQARADAILAARAAGADSAAKNGAISSNKHEHSSGFAGSEQTIHRNDDNTSPAQHVSAARHIETSRSDNSVNFNAAAHAAAAGELQTLFAKQQQLAAQLISIEERARTLLFEFDAGAEQSEARIAAVQHATENAMTRAEQGEKGLEEAVLRAQMRLQSASAEAERRTEAVATEISEQLQALRHDATEIVNDAKVTLHASAREQESRLTNAYDAYAARIQAAQAQIEQIDRVHAQHVQLVQMSQLQSVEQHARGAIAEPRGELHAADANASQHSATLQSAIASANEAIAKLDAMREATMTACRTCDEKSHAMIHLMDHVEGRMAQIGTKISREEFAADKQPTQRSGDEMQRQALMVSQQLHQLTAQAVQVGQWLGGMLQHWTVMQHGVQHGVQQGGRRGA